MIRSELIQKLADANPDLTPRDVETIVTTFFDEICERLAADGRIELRGFGAFFDAFTQCARRPEPSHRRGGRG